MSEPLHEVLSHRDIDCLAAATLCRKEACAEEIERVLDWARHVCLENEVLKRVLAGQLTVSLDHGRPLSGGTMNVRLFCRCGAAWWIIAERERAMHLIRDWEREHGAPAGVGHEPCSAVEAKWARLRQPLVMGSDGRRTEAERSDG